MADYPSCEQSGFFAVLRAARIWDDLEKLGVPEHPRASTRTPPPPADSA